MPTRILIVDDDILFAEYLSLQLRALGYQVVPVAHDAAQALSFALEYRPCVVLMDVVLPGSVDGIHAAESIRAQMQVPILFLSAFEDEKLFQRAKITDASAYLLKPFNERELRLAIELALHRHSEQTLRQQAMESRFQAIFEQAAVGMSQVALDGRWLRVNDKLCDIVGYSRAELLQTTFQAITHPDDLGDDLGLVRQVLNGEMASYSLEKRYIRKDGSPIWIALTVSLVRKTDGTPDYFISIVEDISARKRLELLEQGSGIVLKALAGGEPLTAVLDHLVRHMESVLPGAIGSVLLLDPDGRHLRTGAAPGLPETLSLAIEGAEIGPRAGSCGTAAYRGERVIVEDIFSSPLWAEYQELARLADLRACWSEPLISENGSVLGTFAFYYRMPHLPTAQELAVLATAASLAVLAISRKGLETALRNAGEHRRILFEQTPIGLALCKMDGSLVEVNPAYARIIGRSMEETLTLSYHDITPERYAAQEQEQLRLLETTGRYGPYEKTYRHRDGHEVPVRLQGLILTLDGERFVWSSVEDITERKQAEEALRASESKFRAIIESSPVAMAVNDECGNITLLNRRFVETFGYTPADIPTLEAWWPRAYPDPAYRQRVAQEWQAAVDKARRDNTELEPMEYQVAGKDGSVRDIRFSMAALGGSSLVILYDITERKHMEQEVRETSERLRELSSRMLQLQEEERRHLARELHDEIGQSLTALKITLQSIAMRPETAAFRKQLDTGVDIADAALNQARSLSLSLRPPQLDELGLAAALRWNLERQAGLAGLAPQFAADGIPAKLPEAVAIACYRIAQEALTNVVRHAQAKQVWLRIWREQDNLCLELRDDGKGFDEPALQDSRPVGSFGLLGMEERARLAGGRAKIESAPGGGTRVHATLPLVAVGAASAANPDQFRP